MGTRGRVSTAQLAVLPIRAQDRPAVPHHLPADIQEVWTSTVNALPRDWFPPETLPMLEQYCRHVIRARRFGKMLQAPSLDRDEYIKLSQLEMDQTDKIIQLATKMRLTQQASLDQRKSKKGLAPGRPKKAPWQSNEAAEAEED